MRKASGLLLKNRLPIHNRLEALYHGGQENADMEALCPPFGRDLEFTRLVFHQLPGDGQTDDRALVASVAEERIG